MGIIEYSCGEHAWQTVRMKTSEQTKNEVGLRGSLRKERGGGKRLQNGKEQKEANAFSVMLLAPEPTFGSQGVLRA